MTLSTDWKAIKPKPKGKPAQKIVNEAETKAVEDLHEDWLAIKGAKHPAYAYMIRWEYPSAFAIFQVRVVGKKRTRERVLYRIRGHRTLYKTPGMDIWAGDKPASYKTDSYPREMLCFTIEDVDRYIASSRLHHIDRLRYTMDKYAKVAEEVGRMMNGLAKEMRTLGVDPLPDQIRRVLPKKVRKGLP